MAGAEGVASTGVSLVKEGFRSEAERGVGLLLLLLLLSVVVVVVVVVVILFLLLLLLLLLSSGSFPSID